MNARSAALVEPRRLERSGPPRYLAPRLGATRIARDFRTSASPSCPAGAARAHRVTHACFDPFFMFAAR